MDARSLVRSTALGAALALGLGAFGAAQATTTRGDRIDLLDPPSTHAADSPFYVLQGWCAETEQERKDMLRPSSAIRLWVDGTEMSLQHTVDMKNQCVAEYHNFTAGLPSGNHVLAACWYYLGDPMSCHESTVAFG
jgi:hypothetical protein